LLKEFSVHKIFFELFWKFFWGGFYSMFSWSLHF
jgi:hypothetical protein